MFKRETYKLLSVSLSPNVVGNVTVGLMCNPPRPGDASYEKHEREKSGIIASLRRRARLVADTFNACEGVTCNDTDGAMYSFPRIWLPDGAVKAARAAAKAPDVFYCLALLNETGISTVPGSGFRQKPGQFHFRTTILPREEDLPAVLQRFREFHAGFMQRYGGGAGGGARASSKL